MAVFTPFHTPATYGGAGPRQSHAGTLNFRVISCTSFRDMYPPDNLSINAGSTGGWVSEE